jgi:hypothetical protein
MPRPIGARTHPPEPPYAEDPSKIWDAQPTKLEGSVDMAVAPMSLLTAHQKETTKDLLHLLECPHIDAQDPPAGGGV